MKKESQHRDPTGAAVGQDDPTPAEAPAKKAPAPKAAKSNAAAE